MARRCILVQGLLLLAVSLVQAQGPGRVALQITVSYEGEQQLVYDELTVQLMDGWGVIEEEQQTNRGLVQFLTQRGIHRVRILGPAIEQFDTEFEIQATEATRVEAFQVHKRRAAFGVSTPGKATISAVRLNIPRKAEKEFQKGARAMDQKNWSEARMLFERAIAIYPDYDRAYNSLGVAALNAGDLAAAQRAFEKAIRLNGIYGEAYRNLARVLLSEHKYAEADGVLKKSLQSEPLNTWTLTYAAYAELLTGKFGEAITNARKVHELPHKGFAGAHVVAARALEATHRPDEAIAEYQLYLEEDPKGRDAKSAREAVDRIAGAAHK